jgi:hydrogenase expression/formation protein HypC
MCLALPGKILEIIDKSETVLSRSAKVDFGGVIKSINLAFVEEAKVGQYILAHVGVALSVVDEEEALKTIEAFRWVCDEVSE